MQLMRAVFNCSKQHLTEIATKHETQSLPLDLSIHNDYSDDGETMVSGEPISVMQLIGAVAGCGLATLSECWTYEC